MLDKRGLAFLGNAKRGRRKRDNAEVSLILGFPEVAAGRRPGEDR